MTDIPALARMVEAIDELSEVTARQAIVAASEGMNDSAVAEFYLNTDGEPGNPIADLLAVVAEERGLNL